MKRRKIRMALKLEISIDKVVGSSRTIGLSQTKGNERIPWVHLP
jgi:hypothetical protein